MDIYDLFPELVGPRPTAPSVVPGQPLIPTFSDEEQTSRLRELGQGALSGLAWIGQALDKPGRAVRGLLGGKPSELANLIPFSDTLGITDPEHSVSGRNLLEQAGIIDKGVPGSGLDLGDVLGFGVDVLSNPITAIGGGALSPVGLAAKAEGTLAKTLAARIAAGQGGLAKVGIPFTPAQAVVGTGPMAERFAGKLGAASDWLGSTSPALQAKAFFNKAAQGSTTPDLQPTLIAKNEALPAAQQPYLAAIDKAKRNLYNAGQLTEPVSDEVRLAMEGALSPLPGTPLSQAVTGLQDVVAGMPGQSTNLGRTVRKRDFYATRQSSPPSGRGAKGYGNQSRPLSPYTPFETPREEMYDLPILASQEPYQLRDILGPTLPDQPALGQSLEGAGQLILPEQVQPTRTINELLKDAELKAMERDARRGEIFSRLGGNPEELAALKQARQQTAIDPSVTDRLIALEQSGAGNAAVNAARKDALSEAFTAANPQAAGKLSAIEEIFGKSKDLANRIETLPASFSAEGRNLFGNDIFSDIERRSMAHVGSVENMKAFHKAATEAAVSAEEAGDGSVPLYKLYDNIGMTSEGADKTAMDLLRGLDKLPVHLGPDEMLEAYKDLRVPRRFADDLTRVVQGFREPEVLSGLLKGVDNFISLFRVGVVTPWPSRYIRNSIVQEQWNRFVHGIKDPAYSWADPRGWFKGPMEAQKLLVEGGTVDDLSKINWLRGLDPQQAKDKLLNEAVSWKVIGKDTFTRFQEIVGENTPTALGIAGAPQPGLMKLIKQAIPGSAEEAKPWNLAGIGGRETTGFAPAVAGHAVDKRLDDLMRLGSFIDLSRQGYLPEQAAKQVLVAHYDYSNLSQAERSIMRRLIPFYSWARNNTPAVLKQIAEEPGGLTAQGFKAAELGRQKEGLLPPYVGETLSMPLGGKTDEGMQRYLTTLGLPYEDAFRHLVTGKGSVSANVGRSIESAMSELNPLLKFVGEVGTGKQFLSGRELTDLGSQGLTGNMLADQAIMNSPLSRLATTARTLGDERKGLAGVATNLFSPARIRDVDVEKEGYRTARDVIDQILNQSPNVRSFGEYYVKPEDLGKVTPQEYDLLRLQKTLIQNAKESVNKKVGVRP